MFSNQISTTSSHIDNIDTDQSVETSKTQQQQSISQEQLKINNKTQEVNNLSEVKSETQIDKNLQVK